MSRPLCGVCAGCTLGHGSAGEAMRLARACGAVVFVAYARMWEHWPSGAVTESTEFLRYLVCRDSATAWRRLRDVYPGACAEDCWVLTEDMAKALVMADQERLRAARAAYGCPDRAAVAS